MENRRLVYASIPATPATSMHSTKPQSVGMRKEAITHFQPPVSLRIVKRVVEQGQCIRENSMVQTAVTQVQPLATSSSFNWVRLSNSSRLPWAM